MKSYKVTTKIVVQAEDADHARELADEACELLQGDGLIESFDVGAAKITASLHNADHEPDYEE